MSVIDSPPARGLLHGEGRGHAPPAPEGPRVSVILPAYRSHETVAACLEALRSQEYRSFETVMVDSSPDERTARAVSGGFPEVRLVRSRHRLLPHAARNAGVERARGEILVFIDPDVYAPPGWLRELVAAHDETGHPVVGALACHGRRWLDVGIHLCKFSKWLPGGASGPVDMSPTANMLIDRPTFEANGGFEGDLMLGDALFSWRLLEGGATLWFAPRAEVAHHHLSGFREFIRERFERGVLFGELRSAWGRHGRGRTLVYLLVTVLPIRLVRIVFLVSGHCRRAGRLPELLATLPLVVAGHAASLLGESWAYLRRLSGRRAQGVGRVRRTRSRAPQLTRT